MDLPQSSSLTWKIPDFVNLSSTKSPLYSSLDDVGIRCSQDIFGLKIEFCRETLHSFPDDFCEINLHRGWNGENDPDLTVMWKFWLINQNGDECLSRDIETGYSTTSRCRPVFGGRYRIDRNFILDPSNGLLTDGALIIKSQVIVVDDSLELDLKKFNLSAMKTIEDYQSLLQSSKHSDVVFVVGKDKDSSKEFSLHKAILSARSPVFSRMFDELAENQQNRIEITDIEVEVFEQLLVFIYGGEISSLDKYAADLLVAADKYELELLEQLCDQALLTTPASMIVLTVDNVTAVLKLAIICEHGELKSKCAHFVTANACKVLDTEAWKHVPMNIKIFDELFGDFIGLTNGQPKEK